MEKRYIAAFDQGTTSSRTIIFDKRGRVVSKAHVEFPQIYPKAGWVEHDCEDIFSSQLERFSACARKGRRIARRDRRHRRRQPARNGHRVGQIHGRPVYNAIVWQCRRTSQECEKLKKRHARFVYERTGLNIDAYFSASKIAWILDNVPFARSRAQKGICCSERWIPISSGG